LTYFHLEIHSTNVSSSHLFHLKSTQNRFWISRLIQSNLILSPNENRIDWKERTKKWGQHWHHSRYSAISLSLFPRTYEYTHTPTSMHTFRNDTQEQLMLELSSLYNRSIEELCAVPKQLHRDLHEFSFRVFLSPLSEKKKEKHNTHTQTSQATTSCSFSILFGPGQMTHSRRADK
jgi:hypothetical protein